MLPIYNIKPNLANKLAKETKTTAAVTNSKDEDFIPERTRIPVSHPRRHRTSSNQKLTAFESIPRSTSLPPPTENSTPNQKNGKLAVVKTFRQFPWPGSHTSQTCIPNLHIPFSEGERRGRKPNACTYITLEHPVTTNNTEIISSNNKKPRVRLTTINT